MCGCDDVTIMACREAVMVSTSGWVPTQHTPELDAEVFTFTWVAEMVLKLHTRGMKSSDGCKAWSWLQNHESPSQRGGVVEGSEISSEPHSIVLSCFIDADSIEQRLL